MHASESPVRTPAPCPRDFSVSADVGWGVGAADTDLADGAGPAAEISQTVPFANELPTPTQMWGSPLKGSAALRLLELERDVGSASPRRTAERLLKQEEQLASLRAALAAERSQAGFSVEVAPDSMNELAALRAELAAERARADRAERALHTVAGAQAAAWKQAGSISVFTAML